MKKAQMEIMGLAIIVILLVLGMLFVIGVVIQPSTDIRASYTYEKLASNSLNALLKTSTDCRDLSIKDLLKDCGGDRNIYCGSENSCTYVENSIYTILEDTITPLNKKYNLISTIDIPVTTQIVSVNTSACNRERKAADPFPIRTSNGLMTVNFYVCD